MGSEVERQETLQDYSLWDCSLTFGFAQACSENLETQRTNTYFTELLGYRIETKLGLL